MKSIKVTLINMPIREHALPNTPPMGIAILAAVLQSFKICVGLVDLNAYRIKDDLSQKRGLPNGRHLTEKETEELLEKHFQEHGDQDMIGLSGLITTLRWQKIVAKIARKLQLHAYIVSGGGLATEFGTALFEWIPELNAVATGEGDNIIIKIAQDSLKKSKPQKIVYEGLPVENLDEVPFPAWDLLAGDVNGFPTLETYILNPVWGKDASSSSEASFTMKRSITTVSSRGCPFSCKFCFRGQQGGRCYRARSAENLFKEMQENEEKYNLDFYGVPDDNFMIIPSRITEFDSYMQNLDLGWGTHGRLDEAADPQRIFAMAKAKCKYIGFGAESASAKILKSMTKGGSILSGGTVEINGFPFPKKMIKGIKRTRDAGIYGNCTWIMGWPGETLKDLKTSVAFMKWQEEFYEGDPVNKSLFCATAYPGTEMFEHLVVMQKLSETFGIRFTTDNKPVLNRAMEQYVLLLEDATKLLENKSGKPLNFSSMSDDVFCQAKELVEQGKTLDILDM